VSDSAQHEPREPPAGFCDRDHQSKPAGYQPLLGHQAAALVHDANRLKTTILADGVLNGTAAFCIITSDFRN
jgi:hypothetical protein